MSYAFGNDDLLSCLCRCAVHIPFYFGKASNRFQKGTAAMFLALNAKATVTALDDFAQKVAGQALDQYGFWARVDPIAMRTWFGISDRTSVQINVTEGSQGTIAERDGRRFLCHTGRLNGRLKILRSDVIKSVSAVLEDVRTRDGFVKQYIVVACIDDPLDAIGRDLKKFVQACEDLVTNVEVPGPTKIEPREPLSHEIPAGNPRPAKTTSATQFVRDRAVMSFAKALAKGQCERCNEDAPFHDEDGPFLEVHHLIPLSEGGPDTPNNVIALCPNCHRRMHHSKDAEQDKVALIQKVIDRLEKIRAGGLQPR
jgi:hypothetical protein